MGVGKPGPYIGMGWRGTGDGPAVRPSLGVVGGKSVHVDGFRITFSHLRGIDYERFTSTFLGKNFRGTNGCGRALDDFLG